MQKSAKFSLTTHKAMLYFYLLYHLDNIQNNESYLHSSKLLKKFS